MDERVLLDLIGRIYQAPGDEDRWPGVVTELARAFDAAHGHLLILGKPGDVQWGVTKEGAEEPNIEYARDYARMDKRVERLFKLPDNTARSTPDLMTRDEIRRDPLHQEFLVKYDVGPLLALKNHLDDGRVFLTSVLRYRGDEFARDDYGLIEKIHPHIAQATNLHLQLLKARALAESFEAGLDALPSGIIIFDAFGAVLFANRAARRLLDARNDLRLEKRRLAAVRSKDRAILDAALATALGKYGPATGAIAAITRETGRPLTVRFAPVPTPIDLLVSRATAIAIVSDPDRFNGILPEALAMFGLTSAEARLAAALAVGDSLEDYADNSALSLNTVRSTLKSVFDKTDTHRQGQLISLILRSGLER